MISGCEVTIYARQLQPEVPVSDNDHDEISW